ADLQAARPATVPSERTAEKKMANPVPAAASLPELLEQFRQELTALGGQVIFCTPEEVTARLVDFLREKGIQRVQLTEALPGVAAADLTAAGFEVSRAADERVRVGITPVVAAIAESGSLLVSADPQDALLASLLPPIHLVVMKRSQLVGTLAEALTRPEVRRSAASVIITGPSRTADIEMTLTIGVHGPGELWVFVIDDLQGK
ncbi:MAG: LutC/YkgG family protein, partial [Anaerolineae bacterium]